MTTEEKLAAKTLAYDTLKIMYNKTVTVFTLILLVTVWYLHEARAALELNSKRYDEMRKAYEVQSIYFNNMKARIEALNEARKNE